MLRKFWNLIIDNWTVITGVAAGLSAILLFVKNYHHLVNLRLQNRKLKEEKIKNDEVCQPKYISNLDDYKINFSAIAENSITSFGINKLELIDLLGLEFKNHPIFSEIDYNSLPIPLQDKNFIFLTKLNSILTIEDVNQTVPQSLDIYDIWSSLTKLYFSAFRLPFRRNHLELLNESSYNSANIIVTKLIEEIHNFYIVVMSNRAFIDTHIDYFHRSKFFMSDNLIQAHKFYEDYKYSNETKLLGQVAINFDSIISITHKILIQYYPNGNKFTKANSAYK